SLTYIPNDQRNSVDVVVETKSTLAPQVGTSTTMLLDRDLNTGYMAANELKSKIPGQTYIDIEDGKVKTDTGKSVDDVESDQNSKSDEVESKDNVINLQKN